MAIKCVFFDLYGTLITFNDRESLQKRCAAKHNLQPSDAGIGRGYIVADAMMAKQNAVKPIKLMSDGEREDFFARYEQLILKGAGYEVDSDVARDIWRCVSAAKPGLAAFPDVVAGMKKIKLMGLDIGLISNIDKSGEELVRDFKLTRFVTAAVTSQDAGAEKPHRAIFELALARAQCAPREAVHVGDQLISDVSGAAGANMQPVLIDRYSGHPGYTAHPRVSGMPELVEWLSERV